MRYATTLCVTILSMLLNNISAMAPRKVFLGVLPFEDVRKKLLATSTMPLMSRWHKGSRSKVNMYDDDSINSSTTSTSNIKIADGSGSSSTETGSLPSGTQEDSAAAKGAAAKKDDTSTKGNATSTSKRDKSKEKTRRGLFSSVGASGLTNLGEEVNDGLKGGSKEMKEGWIEGWIARPWQ